MKKERLNYYKEWIEENEEIVVDSSIFKELVDEINRLNNIINKAIEYIEEKFDYVLKDESFLDHDDLVERRIALHLLNILKGDNK